VEQQKEYVGIDLHRKRSVIVRRTEAGETIDTVRIDNDPLALASELAKAGEHPEVVLEATYGWYWAVDVLEECGATVHLAHPLGTTGVSGGSRTTSVMPPTWSTSCGWAAWPRHGSLHRHCASCASTSAIAPSSSTSARASRPRSTRSWPKRACACP